MKIFTIRNVRLSSHISTFYRSISMGRTTQTDVPSFLEYAHRVRVASQPVGWHRSHDRPIERQQ